MNDQIFSNLNICKLTSDEENIVLERFSNSLSLESSRLKLFQQNYGLCVLYTDAFDKESPLYEESLLFTDLYFKPIKIYKASYNGFYFHQFYVNGTWQYLIYYKDYTNCKPTGISLSPENFEKYFKIIDEYKFEKSDYSIQTLKYEIQDAIKEYRDKDYEIEALKYLKEAEHTIKDKLDEINIENFFKIKTNIYR